MKAGSTFLTGRVKQIVCRAGESAPPGKWGRLLGLGGSAGLAVVALLRHLRRAHRDQNSTVAVKVAGEPVTGPGPTAAVSR